MLKAILFNDTSHNKHHGCQIVVRQIYRLATEAGIRIVKACPMRHDWRQDAQLQRDIAGVDLCLINGEGTFHDDARAALMLAELAPFCRAREVPCFLINSVWQRNERLLGFARDFTAIYLRDAMSQRELAAAGIDSEVVPDLTLSAPVPVTQDRHSGLLINGSFYEERTQEAWRVYGQLGAEANYLSIQALPQLQWGKGFPRYFWSSLRSRFKAWRARRKARAEFFSGDLARKQIKLMRWRHFEPSATSFLRRLGRSAGVISGRFHCITLCLLTETPFFAIGSNTHKIESMLHECGLQNRIYPGYAEAAAARGKIGFSEEERQAVSLYVRQAQARARAMFEAIAERVRNNRPPLAPGLDGEA